MRALRQLFFKRSFVALSRGLDAHDPDTRAEARETLARLRFRHAFQPLARIFRRHHDPSVRATALGALGAIPSPEAMDLLVEVLRNDTDALRPVARQLLMEMDAPELLPALEQEARLATGKVREDLEAVLRHHGLEVG